MIPCHRQLEYYSVSPRLGQVLGFERALCVRGSFAYDHRFRTYLALAMDCPEPRPIQARDRGRVLAVPEVGGLHHHYERVAA